MLKYQKLVGLKLEPLDQRHDFGVPNGPNTLLPFVLRGSI